MSQISGTPAVLPEKHFEYCFGLPLKYESTFGALLPLDRERVYVYWEISSLTKNKFQEKYGEKSWQNSILALRLFTGEEQRIIKLHDYTDNWYVYLTNQELPQKGELGRIMPDRLFVPLLLLSIFWQTKQLTLWEENKTHAYKFSLINQNLQNWQPGLFSWQPDSK